MYLYIHLIMESIQKTLSIIQTAHQLLTRNLLYSLSVFYVICYSISLTGFQPTVIVVAFLRKENFKIKE